MDRTCDNKGTGWERTGKGKVRENVYKRRNENWNGVSE